MFVRIENDLYRTDSAHFAIEPTIAALPPAAFIAGYGTASDFERMFAALRDFRIATAIARWEVRRGDLLGFSGDSGYSEAPHLHYAIRRTDGTTLCPTAEPGFEDGGWLFRRE